MHKGFTQALVLIGLIYSGSSNSSQLERVLKRIHSQQRSFHQRIHRSFDPALDSCHLETRNGFMRYRYKKNQRGVPTGDIEIIYLHSDSHTTGAGTSLLMHLLSTVRNDPAMKKIVGYVTRNNVNYYVKLGAKKVYQFPNKGGWMMEYRIDKMTNTSNEH